MDGPIDGVIPKILNREIFPRKNIKLGIDNRLRLWYNLQDVWRSSSVG